MCLSISENRGALPGGCAVADHLNFLFINTDQQRWDTLGCYGSTAARTPNIDRLAADGVRFDRCYTANPVCMPARASWFTGRYPSHHGVWNNGVRLDPAADMIHVHLKQAGYHAALIGKIHLDNIWKRSSPHPKYGFDLLIECEGDPYCRDEYFRWLERHGLYESYMAQFKAGGHMERYVRDIPLEFHMNTWIADHVEWYFQERCSDGRPFFLSVGFFDPHHPFDPVEPYASMFDPADMPQPVSGDEEEAMTPYARERRKACERVCGNPARIAATVAAYHAKVAHVDAAVGRILVALESCGLESRTVVIFTSDHGELLGDHGMLHKGPFFFEGAIRVPMIWRLPPSFQARGVHDGFVSTVDVAPTVAALAGVGGPALMQGMSLFDEQGRLRDKWSRDAALTEWRGEAVNQGAGAAPYPAVRCLTTAHWKYVHYEEKDFGELYDRRADPHETQNLWGKPAYRDVVREMRERLLAFILNNEPLPAKTDIF